MWPEKYRHVVSFAPSSGQAQAFLNLSTGWSAFQSSPWVPNQEPLLPGLSKAPASMHHIASNILDDARGHDEFDIKDFLNMDYFNEASQESSSCQAPVYPLETVSTVSPTPESPIELGNESPSGNKSDLKQSLGPAESDVVELCIDPGIWLAGTVIFFQVLKFMTCKLDPNTQALDSQVLPLTDVSLSDFTQLGVLLFYLNGVNGCSSTASRKRSSAMAFSFARYVDTAKLRILNPLRVDSRFDNFAPMIKVIFPASRSRVDLYRSRSRTLSH